jgi:TolB-like protein/DNA-binding winged helix-turn-helix (wHTH) protein
VSVHHFGRFTLDSAAFRLRREGAEVPLTPKAFEVLVLLIGERHRGLTKQELFDTVWSDTVVTDNTLTQRIKEIREALGDSPVDPIYIRTIPRVGYQFVGDVTEASEPPSGPSAAHRAAGDEEAHAASALAPHPAVVGTDSLGHTERTGTAGSIPETRPPEELTAAVTTRGLRRMSLPGAPVAVVGVLLLAVVAAGLWVARARGAADLEDGFAASGRVMLAVLPFENMSGDPEQEYFSDGLTEETIAELGRLSPSTLGVIARTSSMAYKDTDKSAEVIAGELGVDYVLEGSVRREADRVRIVAQLIRARDQTHVWAERYDRGFHSILALQNEVARTIAEEMRMRLPPSNGVRARRSPSVHPDAYQAYLKGRFFLNQRTGTAILKSLEQFEEAIAIEPGYAQAYAGLADAHELSWYGGVPPRESNERATAAARRALELDSSLEEPHTSLGIVCGAYTWQWSECVTLFERALERNANSSLAHKGYSEVLSFLGRHERAIAEAQRAVELDPLSLIMQANLGITYYRARRFDEAIRQMEHTLEMNPHYMLGHFNLGMIRAATGSYDAAVRAFGLAREYAPDDTGSVSLLGYVYGRMGRTASARAMEHEIRRLSTTQYISPYLRAAVHVGLGETHEALTQLEQAYQDRSWLIATLKVEPVFDALRGDERFEALIRRLNFPEEP